MVGGGPTPKNDPPPEEKIISFFVEFPCCALGFCSFNLGALDRAKAL